MTAAVLSVVGALLGGGLVTGVLLHRRESKKDATETALDLMREFRELYEQTMTKLSAAVDYSQELRDHIYEQKPPPPPPWPDELKNR